MHTHTRTHTVEPCTRLRHRAGDALWQHERAVVADGSVGTPRSGNIRPAGVASRAVDKEVLFGDVADSSGPSRGADLDRAGCGSR